MSILPKAIYRYNKIPIKIPMTNFIDIEQTFQKFIWSHKWPGIAIAILSKKNKVTGATIPDIKLYYKDNVITTVWCSQKNRYIDWCIRIKSPEIKTSLYCQLIFNKGSRSKTWSKKASSLNIMLSSSIHAVAKGISSFFLSAA